MALSSQASRGVRALTVIVVAAAAGAAGCAILSVFGGGPRPLAFSHRVHVVEEELRCINCHEDVYALDAPGMPPLDQCLFCHEELDEEQPDERRIAQLFDEGRFRARRVSALEEEVVFSHLAHASQVTSGAASTCSACHEGIDTNDRISSDQRVRMEDCRDCHAARSVANECATCHSVVTADWAPANHALAWERLHGRIARAHSDMPAETCSMCHTESSCAECHLLEPPRGHTNLFRIRAHGVPASMDRQSCSTCHRPDFCDRCHAQTLPINHTGSWGGTRSRHCFGCHLPVQAEGCFVCHKGTPSHLLAPPMPSSHNPGMNCRQCHGFTVPLLHADNGTACILCHS